MPRNCSVCGNPEISLYWSPRWGNRAYCSFGCSLIGRAILYFVIGLIFIIVTTIAVVFFVLDPVNHYNAKLIIIFAGSFALFFEILSAIGYFLKRSS